MDRTKIGLWSIRLGFTGALLGCIALLIAAFVLPFYGIYLLDWGDAIVTVFSASLAVVALGLFLNSSNRSQTD